LPGLIRRLEAKSLLDAACGDFNWLSTVDFDGIGYLGLDIVPDLIAADRQSYGNRQRRFKAADITSARIPKAGAILCRDCFIHLSFADIDLALANFKRSRSRFLLLTTHRSIVENADIPSGGWRSLNLQLSPFNFPEPLEVILEDAELGKYLGVWRLKDL